MMSNVRPGLYCWVNITLSNSSFILVLGARIQSVPWHPAAILQGAGPIPGHGMAAFWALGQVTFAVQSVVV